MGAALPPHCARVSRSPVRRALFAGLALACASLSGQESPGPEPFALRLVPLDPGIQVIEDASGTTWIVPTPATGFPIPLSLGVVLSAAADLCAPEPALCGGSERSVAACLNGIDDDLDGAIDSLDPDCHGAEGWSYSVVASEARVFFQEATTAGTAADLDTTPNGARDATNGSLEKTEVVTEMTGSGRHGAVSAVLLSLADGRMLSGDHLVLRIEGEIDGWPPGFESLHMGVLRIPGTGGFGLRGSGQRVQTIVTSGGESQVVSGHEVTIELADLTLPGSSVFLRGDANDDLEVNIADAVWILGEIFLAGPPSPCRAAADADADEIRDISDAVLILRHQFQAGTPPPAPYPQCGRVESSNESCGSSACTEAG